MIKKTFSKNNLIPISEDLNYNYNLNYLTKFNLINIFSKKNCNKITLNFGFKEIKFEKKQMILYFFLLELLTNQKCIITTSRKNLISFKIKKGSVTGCKVTLKKQNLTAFLDTLLLGLPRSEIFKGFSFNSKKKKKKYLFYKNKRFIYFLYIRI